MYEIAAFGRGLGVSLPFVGCRWLQVLRGRLTLYIAIILRYALPLLLRLDGRDLTGNSVPLADYLTKILLSFVLQLQSIDESSLREGTLPVPPQRGR